MHSTTFPTIQSSRNNTAQQALIKKLREKDELFHSHFAGPTALYGILDRRFESNRYFLRRNLKCTSSSSYTSTSSSTNSKAINGLGNHLFQISIIRLSAYCILCSFSSYYVNYHCVL